MHKIAYYVANVLAFGGGVIFTAVSMYSVWLFWTDSFWAFAKVFGAAAVAGVIIALVGNALFEYAGKG